MKEYDQKHDSWDSLFRFRSDSSGWMSNACETLELDAITNGVDDAYTAAYKMLKLRRDDQVVMRTREEIEEYRKNKDPLVVFQEILTNEGVLSADLQKEIDQAARKEADTAADFAEASPYPTPDDIQDDVYWEADNPDQRTSQGRLFFS